MSISQDLIKQFHTAKNTPDNSVSQMLGFIASSALEGIVSDINNMLNNELFTELDGYVLALSRIVKHEIAWVCIKQAFEQSHQHLPKRYYSLFGQKL